jgi:hypothetical protein
MMGMAGPQELKYFSQDDCNARWQVAHKVLEAGWIAVSGHETLLDAAVYCG